MLFGKCCVILLIWALSLVLLFVGTLVAVNKNLCISFHRLWSVALHVFLFALCHFIALWNSRNIFASNISNYKHSDPAYSRYRQIAENRYQMEAKSMYALFEHLFCISTLFVGVKSQYPGAPPAEPVNYPMIPTESNWAEFRCFTDDEIVNLREEFGFTKDILDIMSMLSFKSDDWSFESLAYSILWREILGISVDLFQFYEGATTLIAGETKSVTFHSGMLKKDVGIPMGVDIVSSGRSSETRWQIRSDLAAEIENELGTDSNLHLDLWRSFAHPAVVEAMNSSEEIVINPGDDGQFACSFQHGCLSGDSTWYPPQCNATSNARCTVLLQFLPEHDMELNRALILDHNLPVVIKYMGSERSIVGQSNFRRFYEDRSRVIFQLRSTETQSIHAYGWTPVALPADNAIIDAQPIVHLHPRWLNVYSIGLFILRHYSKITQAQIDQLQAAVFVANEPVETVDLRMEKVCDWVKTKNQWNQQYPWGLWYTIALNDGVTKVECDSFGDSGLNILMHCTDEDIINEPMSKERHCLDALGDVRDSYRVLMVKRQCVSDFEEEKDVALQNIGLVLWGLSVAVLMAAIVGTIYWRKEKIIVASSVRMLAVIYLGAAITLLYQMFLETNILSHCILRRFVLQIGFVMMFAALEEKTRRLATIQKNMKLLKSVKITDFQLIVRIGAILSLVIIYLTVLIIVHPIEVQERIVDRQRRSMCEWDERAETAYIALIAAEVLALLLIGRLSWSLRTTNEVYNETKWIGFILFCSVLMLVGYLMAGSLEQESTRYIVESYFVSLSVMVVVLALSGPKFRPILSGTIYNPDSLQYDSISFSASLTKEDLRRIRKYLRRFGYKVYKQGEGAHEGDELVSTTHSLWMERRQSIQRVLSRATEKSLTALFRSDSEYEVNNITQPDDVSIAIPKKE